MGKFDQWGYGVVLHLKRALRAVIYLFNLHTLLLMAASCLAVWICSNRGWSFDMEFSIISTGTIFPLTFALAQAYTRREHATCLIADLKASVVGLYWMHRDWDQSNGFPASLGNDFLPSAVRAKAILVELLLSVRSYLMSTSSFESVAEARLEAHKNEFLAIFDHDVKLFQQTKTFRHNVEELLQQDEGRRHLADIYKWLSQISVLNEQLMLATGYTKGGEGGFSRTSQYLRYLISSVENLRVIKEYRTPAMMRHASGVLLHVFAIILAPYFVHFCSEEAEGGCAAAYISTSSYVMIVMLLYHVQQDLENCFTVSGLDDALFLVAEEVDALTGVTVLHSTASDGMLVRGASPLGGSPRAASPGGASPSRHNPVHNAELPNGTLTTDKPSLKPILENVMSDPAQEPDVMPHANTYRTIAEGHTGGFESGGMASLAAIFTRSASKRSLHSPSSSWHRRASARLSIPSSPLPSPGSAPATHRTAAGTPFPSPNTLSGPSAASAASAAVHITADNSNTDKEPHRPPGDFDRGWNLPLPPLALGNQTEDSPFAHKRTASVSVV